MKDGDIAYLRINQFSQNLPADFNRTALDILKSPAKRIILDLRNNPGGYLEIAQYIAGWFLKKGDLVTIESSNQGKTRKEFRAKGPAEFSDYPLAFCQSRFRDQSQCVLWKLHLSHKN